MAIHFHCAACGNAIRVNNEDASRRGRCDRCGEVLRVPTGEPLPVGNDSRTNAGLLVAAAGIALGVGLLAFVGAGSSRTPSPPPAQHVSAPPPEPPVAPPARRRAATTWTTRRARPSDAYCTGVIDGHTIELDGGNVVRLIGIDTPERGQPFFAEATNATRSLCAGKRLHLTYDPANAATKHRSATGALLAYVYAGETHVNAELLRRGYAKPSTAHPFGRADDFVTLQRAARAHGRGQWAPKPPPPKPPPLIRRLPPRPAPTPTPAEPDDRRGIDREPRPQAKPPASIRANSELRTRNPR